MKRLTQSTLALLILLTALLSFSGCQRLLDDIIDELGGRDEIERTIYELAQDSPDLSELVKALERADLTDALDDVGPFTVFAPDNRAFEALFNQLDVDDIYEVDIDLLTDVLLYHVVDTRARKRDLEDGQMIETLQGQRVKVVIDGKGVYINGIEVLEADIKAANGVVHMIDGILMPPSDN